MLFQIEMEVRLPSNMADDVADDMKRKERDRSMELQGSGKWRHLWRIAGRYANLSIFDVEDAQELHDLLVSLPLFPYMSTKVTALCRHPSSIHADDR